MVNKSHKKMSSRRKYIKEVAGVSIMGAVAGCSSSSTGSSSSGDAGSSSDDSSWTPSRNTIEFQTPASSGQHDTLSRIYGDVVAEKYSDITGESIDYTVTPLSAGGGVEMHNSVYNSDPNSGIFGIDNLNSVIVNQISNPQAEFDTSEIRYPARTEIGTRAIQVNPRTWDVDGHFQLTWEDFVAEAQERTLNWPLSNASHILMAELVREFEPRLNEDNINFTLMDGGGESRAAIQRGDMDGYFGGYTTNFGARNEFYYTQFVFADPTQTPQFADILRGTAPGEEVGNFADEDGIYLPDSAFITNTSYPSEAASQLSSIIQDPIVFMSSPDTPEEVYDTHVEAFKQAGQDQRIEQQVSETYAPENHNPLTGEELEEQVAAAYEAVAENERVRQIAEGIF